MWPWVSAEPSAAGCGVRASAAVGLGAQALFFDATADAEQLRGGQLAQAFGQGHSQRA
jgi:hypothetical protein